MAQKAPLLTLAMIVRDGGQNLASLLTAAAEVVDEIQVADTGSRDKSVAVARQVGAQVREIDWREDFAWARNQILDSCRGRWVLVMDADEQLAPDDWPEIRRWVAARDAASRIQAGRIATRNYLPDSYSRRGWQPVADPDPHGLPSGPPAPGFVCTSKVRVFPNRADIRFRGALHETVEASLREAGVPIVDLSVPVHHFGYLESRTDKDERYLHLAHLKTTEQPHDARAWAELCECAIAVGDHRQALVAIERSLLLDPLNADRRLTSGWLLFSAGKLNAADEQLATLSALGGTSTTLLAEAAHLRAQIALGLDQPRQAASHIAQAVGLCPGNGHFQNTLGSLNLMLGRGEAARAALERSCQLMPHLAEPCLNLAAMYDNAGEVELSRRFYREALQRDPLNKQALAALEKTAPVPGLG